MKIFKHIVAITLFFVSMSYGQRQTVMTDTYGNVVFPTNFWQIAPVSSNTQEFIGTNAFGQTNGFLQFIARRHDAVYPQQTAWAAMADAFAAITPQGSLWIANGDPLTNNNISLVVFSNAADLTRQTNIVITNADAAHGGFRYDATRNVMYASGRQKGGVFGINPTNYTFTNISTNFGAQHRPALIVGNFMYVSKGGGPAGESVNKISLSNDTEVGLVAVASNANTGAIYRMETNPAGTIIAGAMTGLSGSNSVFWTIAISNFTATSVSTNSVIYEVFAVNDTFAFVSGNPSGAYNLTNYTFTEMGGNSYSGVLGTNGNVYFFGDNEIYQYNLNNSNRTTYFTGKTGATDRLYGMKEVNGRIIAIDGAGIIYELKFTPSVSSQVLNISNVVNGTPLPFVTNVSISNNYALLNTNTDSYYEITPLETNRNVLTTSVMETTSIFRVGQQITIRNNSASNNISFLRFNGSSITTIPPQQSKTWVMINQGSATFANKWKQIYSREEMGLGGGLTTNRTFVGYDGTNYTTNTITLSNGVITGWTQ